LDGICRPSLLLPYRASIKKPVNNVDWENRAQFVGLAAQMMRRILVNYAVAHRADKRGGNVQNISLEEIIHVFSVQKIDLINLDEALIRLQNLDVQKAQIVELKFFGGMKINEISKALNISTATVEREWNFARAWLKRELLQT